MEPVDDTDMQEEEQSMIDEAMSEALPLLKSLTDSGITKEDAMDMLRDYADQLDLAEILEEEEADEEEADVSE
jgi:hypothetical protein